MALRCNCGYELGLLPCFNSNIDAISRDLDDRQKFEENKNHHESTCEKFTKWEVYFYAL